MNALGPIQCPPVLDPKISTSGLTKDFSEREHLSKPKFPEWCENLRDQHNKVPEIRNAVKIMGCAVTVVTPRGAKCPPTGTTATKVA